MTIQRKVDLKKFQYGVDIRRGRQLYGMSGKILYLGQWVTNEDQRVLIVEMNAVIAEREARFTRELNGHAHIIHTFGYVTNPSNLTIYVQEYAALGDLANVLMDARHPFSSSVYRQIFAQVADGMAHMASRSIVHGDLGCRNVLVYKLSSAQPEDTLVKITDFGLARWPNTIDPSGIIPIRYCAPEILHANESSSYSQKSDVYSMGVLMWEALSNGEMPYSSIESDNDVIGMKVAGQGLEQPKDCARQFWMIMVACWASHPEQRPTFQQILETLAEEVAIDVPNVHLLLEEHPSIDDYPYTLNTDVAMGDCLEGSYGKTYAAQWISQVERPVVLIKLDQRPTAAELTCYTELRSHAHIVYTFGFVESDVHAFLLLQERAEHGNLQILLQTNRFQPESKVLIAIFLQIIEAMIYLASRSLVHGDLRCANVLVFHMNDSNVESNQIKLTSFASARSTIESGTVQRRTRVAVRYAALELIRSAGRSNYSEMSDVYSMGVLMWEACTSGQVPYSSSMLNSEVRKRKLNGEKLLKPWLCSDSLWTIMNDCWYNEPRIRYAFESMKIRLARVDLKHDSVFQFESSTDVQVGERFGGRFGKAFHAAKWVRQEGPAIVVIAMDEETSRREVALYMQLTSHPRIVHSFGLVRNYPRTTLLVQERAPHGDLQSLLRSEHYRPSEIVLVSVFLQIVEAMVYLVDQHIVHGSLRCEHVLVFQMDAVNAKENLVKLTNFGQARQIDDRSVRSDDETFDALRYAAPETLVRDHFSHMSDVYSIGVLMWQACAEGQLPYASMADENDIRHCIVDGQRLERPSTCLDRLWLIIQDCWYQEPTLRYDFQQIHTRLSQLTSSAEHRQEYVSAHEHPCPPATTTTLREPTDGLFDQQLPENSSTETDAERSRSTVASTRSTSRSLFRWIQSFFGRKT